MPGIGRIKAATRGGGGDTEGAAKTKVKHIVCQFNIFARR